jgi:hypothetical protein
LAPIVDENEPGKQGLHVRGEMLPTTGEYVPATHGMHVMEELAPIDEE